MNFTSPFQFKPSPAEVTYPALDTFHPKFSGYVQVADRQGHSLYKKEIHSPKEGEEFIAKYGQTVSSFGWIKSLFCPMELKFNVLPKELLCPTLLKFASKVENRGLRVIASIFALAADIVTLVPRVIVTPFRAIYLKQHDAPHPLTVLLKETKDAQEALEEGLLQVVVHTEIKTLKTLQNGAQEAHDDDTYLTHRVAIKHFPKPPFDRTVEREGRCLAYTKEPGSNKFYTTDVYEGVIDGGEPIM